MMVFILTKKNWNNRSLLKTPEYLLSALRKCSISFVSTGCFLTFLLMPSAYATLPASEQSASEQPVSKQDTAEAIVSEPSITSQATLQNKQTALESQSEINENEATPPASVTELSTNTLGVSPSEHNRVQSGLQKNPWLFLHAYEATYEVSSEGDKLGTAVRKLNKTDDIWRLQISSKLKKWLLSLKSKEHSDFQIRDNQLFTNEFYSQTKISFKKNKVIQQTFDWQNQQETGNRDKKSWSLPIEYHLFDRSTHLLKLRSDLLMNKQVFDYPISYKGKRKTYSYSKENSETITTKFGEFETVKMVRTSGDDSAFTIWLSPELNYFPVKIAQFEQDKPDVVMSLNKLEFITEQDLGQ